MRRLLVVTASTLAVTAAVLLSPAEALAATRDPHNPRTPALAAEPSGSPAQLRTPRTATYTCDGAFHQVASPNGAANNYLFATAVVSANDVWAVGTYNSPARHTLAEHWNGTSWTIVATPNPIAGPSEFTGVAAISTNDVWAVGLYEYDTTNGLFRAFSEHWNGTSWSPVGTPAVGANNFTFLFAVMAVSTNDVWAVGSYLEGDNLTDATLMEHWNGTSWSVVDAGSNPGWLSQFYSVSGLSTSDVWAVGSVEAVPNGPFLTLAAHWDGFSWTTFTTPNLGGVGQTNEILAVNALETGHAVGVGYFISGISIAVGEAWDLVAGAGSTSQVETGPGSGDNVLEGVDRSGSSAWAVGLSQVVPSGRVLTLAIPGTWNSGAHTFTWGSPGTSENPSSANQELFAVSAVTPSVFWASGFVSGTTYNQTLVENQCSLHFGIGAPGSSFANAPISVTVTAQNPSNTALASYRGTVHFASSDPGAVLPSDYTFTPGDAGTHTFTGVVLKAVGSDSIIVSDVATTFINVSTAVTVTCSPGCQAPAGSVGSRGTTQSAAGTPVPRTSISTNLRLRTGASRPATAGTTSNTPGGAVAPAALSRPGSHAALRIGAPAPSVSSTSIVLGPTRQVGILISRNGNGGQQPGPGSWYPLVVVALLVIPAAWVRTRRSRSKEKSHGRIEA